MSRQHGFELLTIAEQQFQEMLEEDRRKDRRLVNVPAPIRGALRDALLIKEHIHRALLGNVPPVVLAHVADEAVSNAARRARDRFYVELETAVNRLIGGRGFDPIPADALRRLEEYRIEEDNVRRGLLARTTAVWRTAANRALFALREVMAFLLAHPTEERQKGTKPTTATNEPVATNRFVLTGDSWEITFVGDGTPGSGDEKSCKLHNRKDSGNRHLARLLAEPYKALSPDDFFPPPPGKLPMLRVGRDAASDGQELESYQHRMADLCVEIRRAEQTKNSLLLAELQNEFQNIAAEAQRVKAEKFSRHKRKVGPLSEREKVMQRLRMAKNRAVDRFRKLDMSKLADHLDKCIEIENGEARYLPQPGTLPWTVTHPSNISQKIQD